ncbi:hypothetical protein K1T71_011578 [Dendrolimus kikuchii]|uniref:Uncharacterized protein n=1 Tax=Dendrolimus kikuchii TaxID=765133 RepID=A0ACC1CLG7_9NEOP|nr:hypothetical protein K1T71_011578 [Dendrolimus kikuchii]
MGVGLQPLEFTECLADSPHFRENLQRHEKELERTSQQIKRLIKEVKDVVQAAKRLGLAQRALAASMEQFEFACIGASMTEDERVIGRSLHHFAHLISTIEDERDRMLGRADVQIIQPLEKFRKEHIGAVKEGKKKFDKKTAKFCQTQERTLSLSTKKQENVFQEADAAMDMAERDFCQASLEYVFQLQAVQERKKFELVETLLGFVFGWWTFHHTAHDVHADAEPRVKDLQLRIQRTRSNFEETSKQTESLMKKMMEVRQMSKEEEGAEEGAGVSRAGYLFLMEKKAFGTTTWSKQYCTYEKSSRTLSLTPYNQINVKTGGGGECVCVCGSRACADALERRFCWEAVPAERERAPLTLQALSEECERRSERVQGVAALVRALPPPNREMLHLVLRHLRNVAGRSDKNLMCESNLAVCFGPTLLRPERETVASILDLKFYNVVVETLLHHYREVFEGAAPDAPALAPAPASAPVPPHHNGLVGTSPTPMAVAVASRADISVVDRVGVGVGLGVGVRYYSPHHHQLPQHFAPPLAPHRVGVGRSSSSSAESVSSHSASPPPAGAVAVAVAGAAAARCARVRTLYACLGESEGELSFEPNQIITNVCASGEPGWLRGTLNGKAGLVPENYVEPLP